MATHPVFLPGKSLGGRSVVGYSPWGHKEWDTTERLHTFIALLPVTIALYYLKVKVTQSFLRPYGLYSPWNSPGQNTGVGSLSLHQGIFPTQESNTGLLHCGRILYQVSHKERPRILEWVACPFSSRSS